MIIKRQINNQEGLQQRSVLSFGQITFRYVGATLKLLHKGNDMPQEVLFENLPSHTFQLREQYNNRFEIGKVSQKLCLALAKYLKI